MQSTRLRVDHLAFPSFDAAKTYHFYTEVMRFRLTFAADGESAAWGHKRYLIIGFSFEGGEIHFFNVEGMQRPKPDKLPKDIRHVALAVRARRELSEWTKRLTKHGVSYWIEEHDGTPSVYFSDPNGVMFEINAHRPEPQDDHAAVAARAVVRRWIGTRGRIA